MRIQFQYQFFFSAVGDLFQHEWKVQADFWVDEEGENISLCGVEDHTLGIHHGTIDMRSISKELYRDIIEAGQRIGRNKHTQQKQLEQDYELEYV